MKKAVQSWGDLFTFLKKNPYIVSPFLVSLFFSLLALYVLYLAPQHPVASVLAPPIRKFYGEKFLHYPFNIFLLPKIFSWAQIAVGATVGILMSATGIGMMTGESRGAPQPFLRSLIASVKRYGGIFCVWLCAFIPVFIVSRVFKNVAASGAWAVLLPYVVYLIVVGIQLVLAYLLPILVIENAGVLAAIKKNVLFLIRHPMTTFFLVVIPSCVYIPVIILKQNMGNLARGTAPEVVIIILSAGAFFAVAAEFLIVLGAAVYYIKEQKQ